MVDDILFMQLLFHHPVGIDRNSVIGILLDLLDGKGSLVTHQGDVHVWIFYVVNAHVDIDGIKGFHDVPGQQIKDLLVPLFPVPSSCGQNHEIVSVKTGQQILLRQVDAENIGGALQDFISPFGAKKVVDVFEVTEVDAQNHPFRCGIQKHFLPGLQIEAFSVQGSCQRIMGDLIFSCSLLFPLQCPVLDAEQIADFSLSFILKKLPLHP